MCDTKLKIATGLKEVMKQKPIRKITVQDIMDRKNMKRQSFYYHFQDIYEVVEWICKRELLNYMEYDKTVTFEEWVCNIVRLYQKDNFFFRRVVEGVERYKIVNALKSYVEPQVQRLMDYDKVQSVNEKNASTMNTQEKDFLIDFTTISIIYYMMDYACSCKKVSEEEVLKNVRYALEILHLCPEKRILFVKNKQKIAI